MEKGKLLKHITSNVKRKMLVKTDYAVPSGAGTSMHSKSGVATIPQYLIFKEGSNSLAQERLNKKHQEYLQQLSENKLLRALAEAEQELRASLNANPDREG
jgi:hypothetical protein